MKKIKELLLLGILSIVLFSGCSSERMASSSILRTVGLGESAMPIGKGDLAFEFFNDKATTVDVISEISYVDWDTDENVTALVGSEVSEDCRYLGGNVRFGLTDKTEIKIGYFRGSIDNGYVIQSGVNDANIHTYTANSLATSFTGYQFSLKQLISDYDSRHRLSLYLSGKYLDFESFDAVKQYDGNNIEFKYAIIYGILSDPAKRSFPSLALYYNFANTKRNETVENILAEKRPQAVGAEANFNLTLGQIYTNFSVGVEKEIVNKVSDELIAYFGFKLGLHFMINK